MQRSAFFGALAISIAVVAASAAFSATRWMSARRYSPPRATEARLPPPQGAAALLPFEKWVNIFSPSSGMVIASKDTGGKPEAAAGAPKTVYALIGTITSDERDARRAIVWAEGMKEPRVLRERQELEPGVRLSRIEREFVFLARGKEREKLDLLPVGSRVRIAAPPVAPSVAAGQPPPSSSPAVSAGGADIRVTRIGENTFSMDEAGVSQLTSNFNQFMTQVRLIPYFEGSRNAGYRVAAIRPGTAFDKLGFQGGDVIQAVNNTDLSSPERIYTIFQNLKDQKRVSVNVLRQGQKTTLTYEIR